MSTDNNSPASTNMPLESKAHIQLQQKMPANISCDHSDAYPYINEYFKRWEVTHQEILEYYDRGGVDRDVTVMDQYYSEQQERFVVLCCATSNVAMLMAKV